MEIDLLKIVADIESEKKECHKFPTYALYEEVSITVGAMVAAELEDLVIEGKLVKSETLNSHAYSIKQQ